MLFGVIGGAGAGLSILFVGDKIDREPAPTNFELYNIISQSCRGGFTEIYDTQRRIAKTRPRPTNTLIIHSI